MVSAYGSSPCFHPKSTSVATESSVRKGEAAFRTPRPGTLPDRGGHGSSGGKYLAQSTPAWVTLSLFHYSTLPSAGEPAVGRSATQMTRFRIQGKAPALRWGGVGMNHCLIQKCNICPVAFECCPVCYPQAQGSSSKNQNCVSPIFHNIFYSFTCYPFCELFLMHTSYFTA